MKQRLHLSLICAVLPTLAWFTSVPRTPDQTLQPDNEKVLYYNRADTGQINDQNLQDEWHFVAPYHDRISVSVDRVDGNLVPSVTVYAESDHKVLATAEKDGTYARAAIREILIEKPGEYVVAVSRYKAQEGKTTGKYKVVVTLTGVGEDSLVLVDIEGLLTLAKPRQGTLIGRKWQDLWAVNFPTKAPISITAKRVSGTLVPHIQLLDAQQKVVFDGVPDDTFSMASIVNQPLPDSGQYIVLIRREGSKMGDTAGDYELTVSQP